MLTSIELGNYRGFKRYRLRGLARVNLLVGDNGCGKTSVLEALQILGSGGDPYVLGRIAMQRGEIVIKGGNTEGEGLRRDPLATHFFHGHQFDLGAFFRVAAEVDAGDIRFQVVPRKSHTGPALLYGEWDEVPESSLALEAAGASNPISAMGFPVTREGSFSFRALRAAEPHIGSPAYVPVEPQFVAPERVTPRSVADMWKRAIVEKRESELVEAMRLVDKRLRDLVFLGGDEDRVVVALEGIAGRVPLGSLGGGMNRMLPLALSLIDNQSSMLLVDEIETGLHYSVMGDLWRLVIETAKKRNIQVFVATHSLDCVRGLAWLCDNYPDLRPEISLQKIDTRLQEAVSLDAENLLIVADQQIEVR